MTVPDDDKLWRIFATNADRDLAINDEHAGGCDECGHPGTVNHGMDYAGFRRAIGELLLVQAQGL